MRAMLDPKSGTVSGVLPCGVVDAEGKLHNEFVVREMTGEEEDLLAGKGPVLPRLNRVILNCLNQVGGFSERVDLSRAVDTLTAADRMHLLLSIRRASIGDDYNVKVKCSSCSGEWDASIDLANLEITMMSDPTTRDRENTLSSGKIVGWHVMDGRDEEWLISHQKKQRDVLTLAILARVDKIDEDKLDRKSGVKESLGVLKKLSMRERNELRGLFKEEEGTVDTEVEYECPHCNAEFKSDLDVGQAGFFFPQE